VAAEGQDDSRLLDQRDLPGAANCSLFFCAGLQGLEYESAKMECGAHRAQ